MGRGALGVGSDAAGSLITVRSACCAPVTPISRTATHGRSTQSLCRNRSTRMKSIDSFTGSERKTGQRSFRPCAPTPLPHPPIRRIQRLCFAFPIEVLGLTSSLPLPGPALLEKPENAEHRHAIAADLGIEISQPVDGVVVDLAVVEKRRWRGTLNEGLSNSQGSAFFCISGAPQRRTEHASAKGDTLAA